MSTPIIVNPSKPSQVVVGGGTQSGTPIKVTTDLDYNRVQSMINDSIDSIDTSDLAKENTLRQGITSISAEIVNTTTTLAKEATLTHGVNVISQKIDDIHMPELDKSDLAKEATLSSGISTISNKIDNIDLSSVENKVDKGVETLSNKIDNIDTSHLAKESSLNEAKAEIVEAVNNAKPEIDLSGVAQETTLLEVKNAVENIDLTSIESKVEAESQVIQSAIQNIDLSSVENKVDEVKQAVEDIKLPEIDTTELAKQGENAEATMSAVLEEVMKLNGSFAEQIHNIVGE